MPFSGGLRILAAGQAPRGMAMTVYEARRWIIVASLLIAGAVFCFFVVAPELALPLPHIFSSDRTV